MAEKGIWKRFSWASFVHNFAKFCSAQAVL